MKNKGLVAFVIVVSAAGAFVVHSASTTILTDADIVVKSIAYYAMPVAFFIMSLAIGIRLLIDIGDK